MIAFSLPHFVVPKKKKKMNVTLTVRIHRPEFPQATFLFAGRHTQAANPIITVEVIRHWTVLKQRNNQNSRGLGVVTKLFHSQLASAGLFAVTSTTLT